MGEGLIREPADQAGGGISAPYPRSSTALTPQHHAFIVTCNLTPVSPSCVPLLPFRLVSFHKASSSSAVSAAMLQPMTDARIRGDIGGRHAKVLGGVFSRHCDNAVLSTTALDLLAC
jgi:hypothetical protein